MFPEGILKVGVCPGGAAAALALGMVLLVCPGQMLAQRGGGGRGTRSRSLVCVFDCPDIPERASTEDDLKQFEHYMAVQASSDQSAAFLKVMQYAQTAGTQLQGLRELLQKVPPPKELSDRDASLDQAIQQARAGTENFLAALSSVQQSGLKEFTKRLVRADSELEIEAKVFDRALESPKGESEQVAASATNLDDALTRFQRRQAELANDMGIILQSSSQDLTLRLPPLTTSTDVGGRSIAVTGTGLIFRTSAADGHNLFGLRFIADLSDLQQNITDVLRAQLNRSPRCGERIEVREGDVIPDAPATLVVTRLHYERWICPGFQGPGSPTELAEAEGALEVRLTPSLDAKGGLQLASEISKVEAEGTLHDSLLSGDLGVTLREQITAFVLSLLERSANLRAAIPSASEELATLHKSSFQDAGAGRLTLILEGQLQLSDEQVKQFSDQLRERLAAQKSSSPQSAQ